MSASTICFFVPRGAEIIGAAKRYLNALPPVMDLIPGRITPRSYCHKANAGDSESPFHSPVPGGDHPGAGRTKPGRSPLRGAEQTWGRGEGCSWFWSPSSPGFGAGMQVGVPAGVERDVGLAGILWDLFFLGWPPPLCQLFPTAVLVDQLQRRLPAQECKSVHRNP